MTKTEASGELNLKEFSVGDELATLEVFSVKEALKALRKHETESRVDYDYIKEDLKELKRAISGLNGRNLRDQGDWHNIFDDILGLSWALRRHGLEACVSINVGFTKATADDYWGTGYFYDQQKIEERGGYTKKPRPTSKQDCRKLLGA